MIADGNCPLMNIISTKALQIIFLTFFYLKSHFTTLKVMDFFLDEMGEGGLAVEGEDLRGQQGKSRGGQRVLGSSNVDFAACKT